MEHAEEWRPIDGSEGKYEVSSLGRVRSFWFGRCRILSAADNGCGYLLLTLRIHGKPKTFCVHRLVAVAFIPRVSDDYNQVNHINMDRKDNRAENLEWTTQAQNVRHANSLRKCKPRRLIPIKRLSASSSLYD